MAPLDYTDWAGGKVWTITDFRGTTEVELGEKLTFELDTTKTPAEITIKTYNCSGHLSSPLRHDAGEWKGQVCKKATDTEVTGTGTAIGDFKIVSSVREKGGKSINVLHCEHVPASTASLEPPKSSGCSGFSEVPPLSEFGRGENWCKSPSAAYCWTAEDG